jgi:hypothetical protein
MMRKHAVWLVGVLIMLLTVGGCISISHVERLSAAGATYGASIDTLLCVAEENAVNADSERLLSQGKGISVTDRKKIYTDHEGIYAVIETLERLRQHARLLQRYFNALNALATTDAPARAQNAVQGAAAALNDVGQQLYKSPLLQPAQQDALGQLAGLVVKTVQRHDIAKELKARADIIEQQLRIQKEVTRAVAKKLTADLQSIATLGIQREVISPYVKGTITNESKWIQQRKTYVLAKAGVDALSSAEHAAAKLQQAWVAVINREFDELAFHDLLKDIEALVSLAETARSIQ